MRRLFLSGFSFFKNHDCERSLKLDVISRLSSQSLDPAELLSERVNAHHDTVAFLSEEVKFGRYLYNIHHSFISQICDEMSMSTVNLKYVLRCVCVCGREKPFSACVLLAFLCVYQWKCIGPRLRHEAAFVLEKKQIPLSPPAQPSEAEKSSR